MGHSLNAIFLEGCFVILFSLLVLILGANQNRYTTMIINMRGRKSMLSYRFIYSITHFIHPPDLILLGVEGEFTSISLSDQRVNSPLAKLFSFNSFHNDHVIAEGNNYRPIIYFQSAGSTYSQNTCSPVIRGWVHAVPIDFEHFSVLIIDTRKARNSYRG